MEPKQPVEEPTLRQSKSALLEAAQAAVEDQKTKARAAAARPTQSRPAFQIAFLLTALGGGPILLLQPAWLVGPQPTPETPAIRIASTRMALIEAVGRIKGYARAIGRLPTPMQLAGVTDATITIKPLGGTDFEVSRPAGDSLVVVRSTDSLAGLVAASVRALQKRPAP